MTPHKETFLLWALRYARATPYDHKDPTYSWKVIVDVVDAMGDAPMVQCVWTDTGEMWKAPCGVAWSFVDGGPMENQMKFCPVCGMPIAVADLGDEGRDDGWEGD